MNKIRTRSVRKSRKKRMESKTEQQKNESGDRRVDEVARKVKDLEEKQQDLTREEEEEWKEKRRRRRSLWCVRLRWSGGDGVGLDIVTKKEDFSVLQGINETTRTYMYI